MCAAASVVKGEAAESDSGEDDVYSVPDAKNPTPRGAMITGEAPESDEEKSPSMASSVTTHFNTNLQRPPVVFDSLLHKKLSECNVSLYHGIINVLKNTVQNSLVQLSSIDQQLLKSQLRLQRAGTCLRSSLSTENQLAERLSIAAYSSYIPKITIPLPEVDSE